MKSPRLEGAGDVFCGAQQMLPWLEKGEAGERGRKRMNVLSSRFLNEYLRPQHFLVYRDLVKASGKIRLSWCFRKAQTYDKADG